ncbi:MAG: disulfide bond formation protein B [Proteobacteria bacterium]|jgi:disulfide bond formation protein DsbB|nr:MAG: disulfide bond formation protein B [Pseudomonadota bacterium]|tara:strand:- start:595 stop:1056 length:462 start_codon:yes stop_codon:yes gene_type:complete
MVKKIYLSILIISILALISAYFIEYFLGYQPCNLCLLERIPYALSIIIILANFKFKFNDKSILLVLIIIFVVSALLSIYHLGIEQGLIEESFVCSTKDNLNLNKEQLLQELQKMNISCKNVAFTIFGLSLTTYNILLSVIISATLIKIYAKQK